MKTISGSAGISILIPALVLAFSRELAARVDERAAAARQTPPKKSGNDKFAKQPRGDCDGFGGDSDANGSVNNNNNNNRRLWWF